MDSVLNITNQRLTQKGLKVALRILQLPRTVNHRIPYFATSLGCGPRCPMPISEPPPVSKTPPPTSVTLALTIPTLCYHLQYLA